MANGTILMDLKDMMEDIIDENENIRVKIIGNTAKLNLSIQRQAILINFVRLLKDTNIISKPTWVYIANRHMTLKSVTKKLNDEDGTTYSESQIQSKTNYEKRKLEIIFGKSMLAEIKFMRSADLANYERIIREQFMKYSKNPKIRAGICLDIPLDTMTTEITDEQFSDFVSIVMPYLKTQIKTVEQELGTTYSSLAGYFNYITTFPALNAIDKKRLETLKKLTDTK